MLEGLKTRTAVYVVNPDLSITLTLDGEPALVLMSRWAVSPLRTKKRAAAVLAALGDALALGAAHGPCRWEAEMAASLRGETTPGHITHQVAVVARGRASVLRRDHSGLITVILEGISPAFLAFEIANELDRAFKVGGLPTVAVPSVAPAKTAEAMAKIRRGVGPVAPGTIEDEISTLRDDPRR